MDRKLPLVLIILFFLFIAALLPGLPGHASDNGCWYGWAKHMHRYGLRDAYSSGTDYLPLYQYILWGYSKISGSEQNIENNIAYLRLLTLGIDVCGLWFLSKWCNKKADFITVFLLCTLNISYSYNTIVWGQVDAILTALVFISLYHGYNRQVVYSAIFFILALNFKLQAIVFLPIWGLLYINNLIRAPKAKNVLFPILAIIIVQALILAPFIQKKDGLAKVWNVIHGSVDKYPKVGMGSCNVWNWVLPGNTMGYIDSEIWFGSVTYKSAGLAMFLTASFIVLFPLLLNTIKHLRKKQVVITKEQVWLTSALVVMVFYFFNTQMHERYIHPAFIFIIAYSFSSSNFSALILFSIAYFLNLEDVLHWLKLRNYKTLIFDHDFIATLYAIIIIYLGIKLYRTQQKVEETV